MPTSYQGDGRVYNSTVYAGTGNIGSFMVDGDTASLSTPQIGTNFNAGSGVAPIPVAAGNLSLIGGSSLTFEFQGAGTPAGGFGVNAQIGAVFSGDGAAQGELTISGGFTAAFNNLAVNAIDGYGVETGYLSGAYGNVTIGRGGGGAGSVSVEGFGSGLTATGGNARINVGRTNGFGELDVSDGGVVGAFNLTTGRAGGRGIVSVDGARSEIRLGFGYGFYGPSYFGANGYSAIAREFNGVGVLAVQDGGAVRVENVDGTADGAVL